MGQDRERGLLAALVRDETQDQEGAQGRSAHHFAV